MVIQKFDWTAVEENEGGAENVFLLFIAQEEFWFFFSLRLNQVGKHQAQYTFSLNLFFIEV